MRFGVCCSTPSYFPAIKESGYDYIEVCFSKLYTMTDEEFDALKAGLKENGFVAEVANGFFPGDIKSVGYDVDYGHIAEYTEKCMARFKELGGEIAVFGSGKQRNIPDEIPREDGIAQFCKTLNVCADIGAKYGIKLAIEPLNADETNLINTVADSIEICKKSGNKNVFTIADFYHVFRSGESMNAIENNEGYLVHAHLARANMDRRMPSEESDIADCKKWAAALKKGGYDVRLSLEGSWKPEFTETVKNTVPFLEYFK